MRVILIFIVLYTFAMFHWFSKDHENFDIEENRFMKNVKKQQHDRKRPVFTDRNKTLFKDAFLVRKNNITRIRRSKRIVSKSYSFLSRNMYNYLM